MCEKWKICCGRGEIACSKVVGSAAGDLLQERRRKHEVGGQRNFVGVEKMEIQQICCSSGEAACSKSAANLLQICSSGEACCSKKEFVGGEELGNRGSAAAGEGQAAGDLLQERRRKQEVGGEKNFVGVEKMENGKWRI